MENANNSAQSGGGFAVGMSYVLRGLKLITRPKIRRYAALPLLLNIVVFSGALFSLGWAFDYALDRWLPEWLDIIRWLLWPIFALVAMAVVFFGFSIVVNILGIPFNGVLSQAVETYLTEQTNDEKLTLKSFSLEMARTIKAESFKLLYFAKWAIPILLLFLIPGLGIIASPLWLLFAAWMMAIEYIDTPLSNHAQPFPVVRAEMRERRRMAIGFGLGMTALTMIPVLNFIAMPVGVAGATALYVERLRS